MVDAQINNSSPPRKPVMTVKDLAALLGVNITTALRDLKRKGFAIDKVRTRSGQMTSVIAKAEAERYRAERAAENLDGETAEDTVEIEERIAGVLARKADEAAREIAELIKEAKG